MRDDLSDNDREVLLSVAMGRTTTRDIRRWMRRSENSVRGGLNRCRLAGLLYSERIPDHPVAVRYILTDEGARTARRLMEPR